MANQFVGHSTIDNKLHSHGGMLNHSLMAAPDTIGDESGSTLIRNLIFTFVAGPTSQLQLLAFFIFWFLSVIGAR